jgi:hypothetical protein
VGVCAIALIPIVALYYQSWRLPSSLVALGVALVATVLTWALLGPTGESRGRIAVYALCTGLVVGEVAWALGAWPVPPLAEAATAWLATYVLAGISEHAALEHLDHTLLREYLLVGLVGSLAVMIGTWRFG